MCQNTPNPEPITSNPQSTHDLARRNVPSKYRRGANIEEEEGIVSVSTICLSTTHSQYERPSFTENVKLAGRGIRRLVALFAPVARLVAEYDRRHQLMAEHGLFGEEIDPADPRAVAVKAE